MLPEILRPGALPARFRVLGEKLNYCSTLSKGVTDMAKGRSLSMSIAARAASSAQACARSASADEAAKLQCAGLSPVKLVDHRGSCTGCTLCALMCPDVVLNCNIVTMLYARGELTPARVSFVMPEEI